MVQFKIVPFGGKDIHVLNFVIVVLVLISVFVYFDKRTSLAEILIFFPGSYTSRTRQLILLQSMIHYYPCHLFPLLKKVSIPRELMSLLFSKDGSLCIHCYRWRIFQGELGKKRKLKQISEEKNRKDIRKYRKDIKKLERAVNSSNRLCSEHGTRSLPLITNKKQTNKSGGWR